MPMGFGQRVVTAVVLGLLGLAINLAPFDLGWGVHFLVGGVVAYAAMRVLGAVPMVVAVAIAASPTLLLWNHPWAVVIWVAEAGFVGWAHDRQFRIWCRSPLLSDLVFWSVAGVPLVLFFYVGVMDTDVSGFLLIAAKQIANSIFVISISELLYFSVLRVIGSNNIYIFDDKISIYSVFSSIPAFLFSIFSLIIVYWSSLDANIDLEERKVRDIDQYSVEFQRDFENWFAKSSSYLLRQAMAHDGLSRKILIVEPSNMNGDIRDPASYLYPQILAINDFCGDESFDEIGKPFMVEAADQRAGQFVVKFFHDHFDVYISHKSLNQKTDNMGFVCARYPIKIISELVEDHFSGRFYIRDLQTGRIISRHGFGGAERVLGRNVIEDFDFHVSDDSFSRFGAAKMNASSHGGTVFSKNIDSIGIEFVGMIDVNDEVEKIRKVQLMIFVVFVVLSVLSILIFHYIMRVTLIASGVVEGKIEDIADGKRFAAFAINSSLREIDDIFGSINFIGIAYNNERDRELLLRENLNALSANANIAFYVSDIVDGDRRGVRFHEDSLKRLTGLDFDVPDFTEWCRKNCHPDDLPALEGVFCNMILPSRHSAKFRLKCDDGEYRWFMDMLACSLVGEGDRVVGTGILVDVNDRELLQAQLIQAGKLASIGELAAGVAHELNQPLNFIRLAARSIGTRLGNDDFDVDDVSERLAKIEAQVERAANIISQVGIFARTSDQDVGSFNLVEAISAAFGLIQMDLLAKGITCLVDLPEQDLVVSGDRQKLEQVIINLLVNARDALVDRHGADTFEGRISLSLQRSGNEARINIRDNGGGIPARLVDRVFDPFVTTKPVGSGTGLGLSISYGIIKAMDGDILVETSFEGTLFTVILPIMKGA